jgi:hypothetical protein
MVNSQGFGFVAYLKVLFMPHLRLGNTMRTSVTKYDISLGILTHCIPNISVDPNRYTDLLFSLVYFLLYQLICYSSLLFATPPYLVQRCFIYVFMNAIESIMSEV